MQVTHNEVTRAILSLNLGTDTARVARTVNNGGQPLIDTLGAFLTVEALAGMNQKAIMRAVQAVSFAVSGAVEDLDKVTAAVIAVVMLSADHTISFASMRFAAGQSNVIDAKSVNGVSRAKLQSNDLVKPVDSKTRAKLEHFGLRGGTAKTIESKVARSVGKRGFLTALGITKKTDAHSFTLQAGARESGFVLGFASQLQALTEGALQLVYGSDNE